MFRRWLVVCLLGFLVMPLLFAEPGEEDGADVAIVVRSLDASSNTSLSKILTLAASLQLDRKGYRSVILAQADETALQDPVAILKGAESEEADYLLLVESSEKEGNLSLRFAWFDSSAGKWITDVQRSGPEDMLTDEMVFKALDDLLDRVAEIAPIKAKPPKAENIPAQNETPLLPVETPLALPKPEVQRGPSGLELGFSGAPFLAGGDSGSFFQAAGDAGARVTWYFPGRILAFGLGLSATCMVLQAQGPLESATGILAPLALDLRLIARAEDEQFRPYLHAAVGESLMSLQTQLYGNRFAFLPYAGAGLGLGWVLGSGLGLSIDLSYLVFLDGEDLIMGFNPGVEIDIPVGKRP